MLLSCTSGLLPPVQEEQHTWQQLQEALPLVVSWQWRHVVGMEREGRGSFRAGKGKDPSGSMPGSYLLFLNLSTMCFVPWS